MKNTNMRKSNVIMLSVIGLIFLFIFVLLVVGRIAVSRMISSDNDFDARRINFSSTETMEFDVRDFRGITFIGSWEVDIKQGDDWMVELTYPKELEDELEVELRDEVLVLDPGRRGHYRWNWGWWDNNQDRRMSARITMPELESLNIAGASDLDFNGFSGDVLDIIITGAGDLEGDDGRYDSLNLTMSGAGSVDLLDMDFVNANVILSGAGNVELGMDGGVLSGNLSGFGNIEYSGRVRDERVNVSGFGKVGRRN